MKALVLILAGLIGFTACDDSSTPSSEDILQAEAEWLEVDPFSREMACNIYISARNGDAEAISFIENIPVSEPIDEGLAQAKIDIMDRECEQ